MKNVIIVACCRSGHNFIANQIRSWGNYLIFNFEDVKPEDYQSQLNTHIEAKVIDMNLETFTIIVVRDLLNWWASYMKWITKKSEYSSTPNEIPIEKMYDAFSIWLNHMLAAKGITNYMPDAIDISYDDFCGFSFIREMLCDELGGKYSEDRMDIVLPAGGGSSFDKDIPGTEMRTFTRYKQVLNSPLKELYLEMLRRNPAALETYRTYFPAHEPKIRIIDNL